ncbi:unnamed protein product [Cyprideis torosa]|uniref:Uncharacterized protein n=1 Tax=Cyprideis torosa TaxID=163714 RepID=A0A7R8ZSF6_9CRUS|nr:unnamed protein product [Cyprideis torosa]CAG0905766.1 unnamed protein product [Cyprideis torosa]
MIPPGRVTYSKTFSVTKGSEEFGYSEDEKWAVLYVISFISKFKGCFAKRSPQRLIEMAETKMDIEEPSLEPPRKEMRFLWEEVHDVMQFTTPQKENTC